MLVVPALRDTFPRFFPTAHEPRARLYRYLVAEAHDYDEMPRTDVLIQCFNGPLPLGMCPVPHEALVGELPLLSWREAARDSVALCRTVPLWLGDWLRDLCGRK